MDKISALMDGELETHQVELQVARLKQDPEARASWDNFHLIGAAMRGERMTSANLARRLSDRLAQEPTVLAPRPKRDTRVTTYALSAAASISAIAVVGWVAFHNPLPSSSEVAAIPAATAIPGVPVASAQLASVPRDGKMNEYLMAHQGFSPSTAIQGLAPYVRTVSATLPASE